MHHRFSATLLLLLSPLALGAQARSLPPDVLVSRNNEPHFTHESITLTPADAPALAAHILVPGPRRIDSGDDRLPVLMLFGGLEETSRLSEQLDPRQPFIVSSFDYPFTPPRRLESIETIERAAEAKRAVKQTLAGAHALVDALKARGDVDAERITIVGAGFGAVLAVAAAAADHDISGLVLVQGFGHVAQTMQAMLAQRWKNDLSFMAPPLAWLAATIGWFYLEAPIPEDLAPRLSASQRVLMLTAADDQIVPRESVESLWRAISASPARHERVDLPGGHLRSESGALTAKIEDLVSNWLQKTNLH